MNLRLISAFTGAEIVERVPQTKLDAYKPTSVALMMTTACQLRCTYCYAEAGSTPTQNLSRKVTLDAIDLICTNALELGKSSITVHFHGAGEPTLLWKQIFDSLEYARKLTGEKNLKLNTILTTNLCIDPTLAVRFAEEIDVILVSCDGTPDVMDVNRPMIQGSSGETIDFALRAVVNAGYREKLLIRATITQQTQSRLSDFIRYFGNIGLRHVYLVPVSDSGRGISHESVNANTFVREWREAMILAKEFDINLESPVTDLDRLKPSGFACGINGSNFAVMPDGRISVCYEAVLPGSTQDNLFKIGIVDNLSGEFSVDLEQVNRIRKSFHVSQREVCTSCFAKFSCGGRCAAREIGPDSSAPRNAGMTVGCDITRTLTFDSIVRRINESKGEHYE